MGAAQVSLGLIFQSYNARGPYDENPYHQVGEEDSFLDPMNIDFL
jgi:hypothetical protein